MATKGITLPPDEHEQQRRKSELWARRRRNALVYGGSGGGAAGVVVLLYLFFFAAVVYKTVEEAVTAIAKKHPGVSIAMDEESGLVTSLTGLAASTRSDEPVPETKVADFALDFVKDPAVAKALGVPEEAQLDAPSELVQPDLQLPEYDIVRIEQFVDKVRLFGAEITVGVRKGASAAIETVTTRPAPPPEMGVTPTVEPSRARQVAAEYYNSLAREPERRLAPAESQMPELVVFDPSRFGLDGAAALAWRVRLSSVEVFVDAKNGSVMLSYDDRPTALDRQTYDCRQTRDCPLILDNDKPVLRGTQVSTDARNAHDAAMRAHAYFKTTHKRDGFDDTTGNGGKEPIKAQVQVRNFDNAQWVPELKRFDFSPGWATLDIAAHEYTHAVTTYGPGIKYLGEAGAVSEFFADFFGMMVQRSATGVMDWAIGEGLPGRSAAKPLRSMKEPHNGGFQPTAVYNGSTNAGQPEHFDELVKPSHPICGALRPNRQGVPDSGCVHFNGGILSKAMYLILSGDSFNSVRVTRVAPEKIEQILFRTLRYSNPAANLLDTANGAVRGCSELVGAYGIQLADCTALRSAFLAVKMPVAAVPQP